MKKILFNDRFGLTQAVLSERKTMTRRIVKGNGIIQAGEIQTIDVINGVVHLVENNYDESCNDDFDEEDDDGHITLKIPYKVDEVVAIAQSYRSITEEEEEINGVLGLYRIGQKYLTMDEMGAGWTNKMFVRADLMPHHIRFTDIKAERLQDISDEDCISEGIRKWTKDEELFKYDLADGFEIFEWRDKPKNPREAFAALIDKVSGKGTWDSNPWVFAYEFELVD